MDAIQEKLDRLIREDCLAHEERLRVWVEAAEDMERAGEDHREVLDLLFWAQVEFRRRRTYLGLEESDLERWAAALLRRLGR